MSVKSRRRKYKQKHPLINITEKYCILCFYGADMKDFIWCDKKDMPVDDEGYCRDFCRRIRK